MIDEKLMVGNYIQHKFSDKICKVFSTYVHNEIEVDILTGLIHKSAFSPIPITSEILIACGFVKDNYGLFEIVKDNKPYVSGCEIEIWIKQCEINNELVWDVSIGEEFGLLSNFAYIKHLHQLQNICYLKTGKELNYKP